MGGDGSSEYGVVAREVGCGKDLCRCKRQVDGMTLRRASGYAKNGKIFASEDYSV